MVLQDPGAAVSQRQLWPEGSCYVWLQAGKRIEFFSIVCCLSLIHELHARPVGTLSHLVSLISEGLPGKIPGEQLGICAVCGFGEREGWDRH